MTRNLAFAVGLAAFAAGQQPAPPVRGVTLADGRTSLPAFEKQTDIRLPSGSEVTGDVEMEIVVGMDGSVVHLRIAKSPDPSGAVDRLCLDAVQQWTFHPSMNSGLPRRSLSLLHLTFSPQEPKARARMSTVELKPGPERWVASAGATPLSPGGPVAYPTIVREVNPSYTPEAMRARIQGIVTLDVTIAPDGTVGAANVRKSLDPSLGLDEAALVAARYWLFRPAMRNGVAVPANVVLDLEYRLR